MSNPFPSILVPLDGSHLAAQALGCATWLASRLGASVHVLSATTQERPPREELARLKVPEEYWPLVTLHQASAYPEQAILAGITRYDARLVVITARGEAAEAPTVESPDPGMLVGHATRAVIERSAVPVLLLPQAYRERLPWERVLVPISGEPAAEEALALAVRLADLLDLDVHVAHVSDENTGDESLAARARYADALHHEYPRQLDELISGALPHCTPQECRRIADVALCQGDVAAQLLALVEQKRISLLAVGWHGRFIAGHARVLKNVIEVITTPVLLVKREALPSFRLKVGPEIE